MLWSLESGFSKLWNINKNMFKNIFIEENVFYLMDKMNILVWYHIISN